MLVEWSDFAWFLPPEHWWTLRGRGKFISYYLKFIENLTITFSAGAPCAVAQTFQSPHTQYLPWTLLVGNWSLHHDSIFLIFIPTTKWCHTGFFLPFSFFVKVDIYILWFRGAKINLFYIIDPNLLSRPSFWWQQNTGNSDSSDSKWSILDKSDDFVGNSLAFWSSIFTLGQSLPSPGVTAAFIQGTLETLMGQGVDSWFTGSWFSVCSVSSGRVLCVVVVAPPEISYPQHNPTLPTLSLQPPHMILGPSVIRGFSRQFYVLLENAGTPGFPRHQVHL